MFETAAARQAVFGDGSIHALDFGYETTRRRLTFAFCCTAFTAGRTAAFVHRRARRFSASPRRCSTPIWCRR